MTKGQTVVDMGSGPGVFTHEYVRGVGESDMVFAIEKSPEAARYLANELGDAKSVKILLADAREDFGNISGPNIIFVTDMVHNTRLPERVIQATSNSTTIDGKILIAEFDPIPQT